MQKLKYSCTAVATRALQDNQFAASVEGLALTPKGSTPFCLSYEIYLHGKDMQVDPRCQAWTEKNGRIYAYELGHNNPDITRQYAPQILTFLAYENLVAAIHPILEDMNKTPLGETYHLGICPHGALIIADAYRSMEYAHGSQSVVGAIIAPNLSSHAHIRSLHGLQDCASALLQHQEQGTSDSHQSQVDVVIK